MKRILSVVLMAMLSTVAIFAQSTTGRIVGTVTAPDGAVPGAVITVTDTQTNKTRTVTANDDGTFEVSQLSFGVYSVKITANGFKTFIAPDVKIDAGREFALNAALEVGQITEEVTVTAGAENVNSTAADLTTTVSPQQIRELPLNSRNPLALLNLQAGVNATSSSINGMRTSSVNYTRDGINVQDNFIRNGFVSDQPTVDNTGEFNVTTQNAGVELGSGSTQVQLVTPRGGRELHGALYAFNRNSEFTANNFFNNLNGLTKPFLNRNQFGGSVSGPLPVPNFGEGGPMFRKDKTFFFFNYEGFRLAQQVSVASTTLLEAAYGGNFSYIGTDGVTRTVNVLNGTGLNTAGANATVFANAGGVLGVDPIIKARLLDKLPKAGNGNLTGVNYLQVVNLNRSDPEQRNAFSGRVDFELSDRSSLNFVYKRNNINDARTDIAAGFSTGTFASQGGPANLVSGAWQWSPTNNFSNEVRVGFQRTEPFFFSTAPFPTDYLIAGTPFTNPEPSFFDQGRNSDYWTYQDNAVYTLGNHSFRFGFQAQTYKIVSLNYAGTKPTYTISTTANTVTPALTTALFTSISATDLARANALRYTLAGIIGAAGQSAYYQGAAGYVLGAPQTRKFDFEIYAGYFSDQWRVRPNFTLNYGARYELYTPLHDPSLINLEPQVTGGNPVASLLSEDVVYQVIGGNAGRPGNFFKTDKNNIGPNVSFAYSPKFENGVMGLLSKDTVLRGGFRISYNNDEYVRSTDNAALNNAGLGTAAVNARRTGTTSNALASSLSNIPPFNGAITFTTPTVRPYPAKFQDYATTFTDTLSLIDPNLQIPLTYEYNLGIQKNIGFQSVFEVRYVGSMSNQMTRSIDYNQVNINTGYLADFVKAQSNCRLQATASTAVGGVGINPSSVFDPIFSCTSAAYNPNIAGSQPLTYFAQTPLLSLTSTATLGFLRTNQVAEMLFTELANGRLGYTENAIRNQVIANAAAGVANFTTNGGKFRYNALQAEVRRRFSQGFSYQVNYTFQKILADVVDDGQTRVNPFLDNNNPKYDYARPDYDRTHTVNANVIYELPFGKGKMFLNQGGWVDKVFGGFQMTSIVNISSGVPIGVLDTNGTLNRAGRSGRQSATSTLSKQEIQNLIGEFRTPNGVFYINPSVLFALGSNGQRVDLTQPLPTGVTIASIRGANPLDQAPFSGQVFFFNKAGQTGNLERNLLNGPIYINWDAGLSKNIRINEGMRLQLRAELYNVLNRANFTYGDLNITNQTNFGRITSVRTPRIMQFGARFDF